MSDGRTHWDDCWREHRDCAVAKVERLRAALDSLATHSGQPTAALLDMVDRYMTAVAEEREACAQLAETVTEPCMPNCDACLEDPRRIAAAIRARNKED